MRIMITSLDSKDNFLEEIKDGVTICPLSQGLNDIKVLEFITNMATDSTHIIVNKLPARIDYDETFNRLYLLSQLASRSYPGPYTDLYKYSRSKTIWEKGVIAEQIS